MIFGAIAAGGRGTRMKSACEIEIGGQLPDIPKQFLPLGGRPMICYSIEKFLHCGVDCLFIGVHPDYTAYMSDIIAEHFPNEKDRIVITEGGGDRNETVMRMIDRAQELFGEGDEAGEHFIITHDAARPFVTCGMIRENIRLVKQYGAVDTVIPAADTVVVSDGEYIESVPDRSRLYCSQTPQSFSMKRLKEHYQNLTAAERASLTDCCKIFTLAGERVYLARGDSMNMKITSKNDYFLASAIARDVSRDILNLHETAGGEYTE